MKLNPPDYTLSKSLSLTDNDRRLLEKEPADLVKAGAVFPHPTKSERRHQDVPRRTSSDFACFLSKTANWEHLFKVLD